MFYFSNIFCWFTFHAIEGPDVNNALKRSDSCNTYASAKLE